ncbi:MAG: DUF2244 domain-containing protein [Gammaproteobacteria bacterium]|nr:DUF2244 domain-containing protein [Gammaproteobacteria bacterium]
MHLFELSPNCSLTSGTAVLFYLSIMGLPLTIAGAFAAVGLWPILPFAGLELLAIAVALRISLRRGSAREVICIDERDVVVTRAAKRHNAQYRFARPWTQVELRPAPVAHWPSRLLLGSMRRSVEVGAFLTEGERRRLWRRLAELLPAERSGNDRRQGIS